MTSSKPSDGNQSMTSEEMIAHSSNWTLALDNAVLDRLKKFSEVVDTASQEINTDCDRLSKDINCLQSRIANVTNEFLMLSNTQFVENRVQEFEETMEANNVQSAVNPDKKKSKAEKEAELFAKMKEAIQIGVSANPSQDKRLSELQEESPLNLNLPHLIGTAKFFSSKYCGLTDDSKSAFVPPVSEPLPTNADNFPIQSVYSASSDSLPSTTTSVDTTQSHENLPKIKELFSINNSLTRGNTPQLVNTEQSSEQMNPDSENQENKNVLPVAKETSSIVEELNNAFRARVPPPPENTESDESDDDFKPSAGGRKLFDDDDDDLFGEKSLFAGRTSEDIFGLPKSGNLPDSLPKIPSVNDTSNKPTNTLFDDDSFDFGNKTVPVLKTEKPLPADIRNEVKPQSEEVSTVSSKPKPKIPAGAVNVMGLPNKTISRNKDGIQKTEEKRFETEKSQSSQSSKRETEPSQRVDKEHSNTSQPSLTSNPPKIDNIPDSSHQASTHAHRKPKTTNSQSKSKKVNSLFDDVSDDDLFAPSKFLDKKPSNSLFDNTFGKSNPPPLVTKTSHAKPKGIKTHSIFDDSDSGDDLFSSASSSSSKTKEKSVINVNASGIPVFKPATRMFAGRAPESLFDDKNEDDNIFIKDKKTNIAVTSSQKSESKEILDSNPNTLFNEKSSIPNREETQVKREVISNQNQMNENLPISSPVVSGPKEVVVTVHNNVQESEPEKIEESKNVVPENPKDLSESTVSKISESTSKGAETSVAEKQKEGDIVNSDSFPISSNVVTRPQSLHIQSVNLPSNDTRSSKKNENIFSENSDQLDSPISVNRNLDMGSKSVDNTTISENSLVNASPKSPIFDGQNQSQDSPVPSEKKGSVKDMASKLKINPLALRPGYRPPKPESPSTPTFDKTVDSDSSRLLSSDSIPEAECTPPTESKREVSESSGLLSSAAKHRPKIMQKRRLPSRKLRNGHLSSDKDNVGKSISEEEKTPNDEGVVSVSSEISIRSSDEQSEPPSPMVPKDILSPSTEEEDIFSIGIESNHRFYSGAEKSSPEDTFLLPKPNPSNTQQIPTENFVKQPDILKEQLEEVKPVASISKEDIRPVVKPTKISVTKRIPLPSSRITQCSDSDSDDLFPTIGRKSFPDSSLQQKSKDNSFVKTENYASTSSSTISETLIASIEPDDVLDNKITKKSSSESKEGLEDPAPSRNNAEQKSRVGNRVINRSKSLFSDEDDEDDDIFASKMKPATSAEVSKLNEKKGKANASSSSVPEKVAVPKKPKGLFDSDSDDEGDIFGVKRKKSTVFASTKTAAVVPDNSSAQRKNTQKAVVKNTLFNDSSDEDIFTSSLVSKKEAKKNVIPATNSGAQSSSRVRKTNDDIFDDPLNS